MAQTFVLVRAGLKPCNYETLSKRKFKVVTMKYVLLKQKYLSMKSKSPQSETFLLYLLVTKESSREPSS